MTRQTRLAAAVWMSACAGLAACPHVARAQVQEPNWRWESVKVNGMGFVTGIQSHPLSGDIFTRTDVGGIYRFDRSRERWVPLMDALPLKEQPAFDIESLALDPANPQRIAIFVGRDSDRRTPGGGDYVFGDVLLTTDGGATWTPQGLLSREIRVGGNREYRGFSGERMVFDPRQPDRMIVASRVDGVFIRESATSPWSMASGNPVVTAWSNGNADDLEYAGNTPGHTFVMFDRNSSALPDGATSVAYLGDHATGVYRSGDGGRTWSLMTGSPLRAVHAIVHHDGTLYVSSARYRSGPDEGLPEIGAVHRYDPSTQAWTDITPLVAGSVTARDYRAWAGLAAHPTNASELLLTPSGGSEMYRSTDRGLTWTRIEYTAPRVAYHETPRTENYNIESTDWGTVSLLFDPTDPDTVWQTNGFGVIRNRDFGASPATFGWVMDNFEELVVHQIACPPVPFEQGGADLLSAVMDMVGLRHERYNEVPTVKAAHPLQIGQANGLAYSYQQPNHAAVVGWDTWRPWFTLSGVTSDNGRTWTPFANTTPGQGGAIAMSSSDPQRMIWEPAFWKPLYVTTDGGATWNVTRNLDAVFDPNNTDPSYLENWWKVGWGWHVVNTWWTGQHIAADKVNGMRFYRYTWGRFMHSTDGGANWREGFSASSFAEAPGTYSVRTRLVTHPTREGEVWICEYPNSDSDPRPLHRTTDGGVTVQRVASVQWATHVAFGKNANSATPAIYIHGTPVGASAEGVYVSRDDGATWTLVSDPAQHKFAKIMGLEADMRIADRVFVALGGRGIVVGNRAGSQRCDSLDFNRNGVFPEDQDVIDFFDVLAGGACPYAPVCDIDFDNDGVFPADADVIAFFDVLAGGACP